MRELPLGLRCYLWVLYLATAALVAIQVHSLAPQPLRLEAIVGPVVFVVLTYLGERTALRVKKSFTTSQITATHIASILLFAPPFPLLITLAAVVASQTIHARSPLYKRLYNISHDVFMVGFSSLLFYHLAIPRTALSPTRIITSIPVLALLLALYYVLDVGLLVAVFALLERRSPWRIWRETSRHALIPELGSSSVGILVAVVWLYNPLLLILFTMPAASLHAAFRAIAKAEQRGEQLEAVLQTGQKLRLQQTQPDIMLLVAEAARSFTQATAVVAYLRKRDEPSVLERLVQQPEETEAPEETEGAGAGMGDGPERQDDAPGDGPNHAGAAPVNEPDSIVAPAFGQGVGETEHGGTRTVTVPIEQEEAGVIGLLRLSGLPAPLSADDRDALTILATQTAIALENARMHERALALASEDGLTGLLNHRAFQMRLDEEIARAQRGGRQLSLLMIDLDDFGAVNNTLGHQAGDATLAAVATTIRATLRGVDVVARYGGDEFAAILPETSIDEALLLAQRLRSSVSLESRSVGSTPVTASIGVAMLGLHGESRDELVQSADDAAYAAKSQGKDSVCRPEDVLLPRDPSALAQQLENANTATVEALANAVDAKDPYTRGHSQRVSSYAVLLGLYLDLPESDLARIRLAGVLHDVGKIGVPDEVLKKTGALTDEEFAAIKLHPVIGERMLSAVPFLQEILPAVRHHHERYDGRGYPDGIAGAAIPPDAAILAVADSFDAMTSSRPYRPALSFEEACRRVSEGSGTQFDPAVVAAFEAAVAAGPFLLQPSRGSLPLDAARVA